MNIGGVDVYPGRPCPHSTGSGCDDYAHRPLDPCVNFRCGWIVPDSPLPDWMKPDRAKVLVVFNKLTWQGLPVDLAVPVGKRIPPRALQWLQGFARKHARPLIYTEQVAEGKGFSKDQNVFGYGPQAFLEQLAEWKRNGTKLW